MGGVRNESVYEAARAYVESALEEFAGNYQEGDDHFREIERWHPAEGDAFRKETTEELDPWPFLFRIEQQLHDLPEYGAAREVIAADPVFGTQLDTLVGTVLGGHRVETQAFLDGLLVAQLRRSSFDLDEDSFLESYLDAESAFYEDELNFSLVEPLVGLTIDGGPIELVPGLEIARLTDEEIAACLEMELLPLPFPPFGGVTFVDDRFRHGIRYRYALPKRVSDDHDEAAHALAVELLEKQDDMLNSVVQALRLFKGGTLSAAGRLTSSTSWFLRGSRSYAHGTHQPGIGGNQYALLKSDEANLRELWAKLTSDLVTRRKALMLALRRFSLADDRLLLDDKMLDLMIAAEALFLTDSGPEEDRGELSYRLSLRAGFLLGDDGQSRRESFQHMRRAYRVRSKIAHGGEVTTVKLGDGSEVDLAEFVKSTHRVIREAIIAVIDRVQPDGPLVDWESLVLGDQS